MFWGQPSGGLGVWEGCGRGCGLDADLPLDSRTQVCSNVCMPTLDLLPPHLTPEHTSWPLPGQQHVGAFHGPDGSEVAHYGHGFWHSYGIYKQADAERIAETMYLAWETVRQIPPSAMRSLLEFFQPKATGGRMAASTASRSA